jgi:hypothetical protein
MPRDVIRLIRRRCDITASIKRERVRENLSFLALRGELTSNDIKTSFRFFLLCLSSLEGVDATLLRVGDFTDEFGPAF